MIGRADIEGSKSDVAMNAWPPQASYPCGNFSDTSSSRFPKAKGSIGHAFAVCIRTENQNQESFYPFVLHEISVLVELPLGHLRYPLADVPPQPNSPPVNVLDVDPSGRGPPDRDRGSVRPKLAPEREGLPSSPRDRVSETTSRVVVFQDRTAARTASHLCYTSRVASKRQTRVKLNRVFFPR